MATTITPGIGAGALMTQQGVGTSPGYAAVDVRRMTSLGLQEGVYAASDFMVVQRGAGANMSVDIGMPAGGFACVQGDSVSGQGLYVVPVHSATVNEVIASADVSSPRVDSVILEVLDNVHDASGNNLARVRVLTGTPTAGTTLDSRFGAPTLPGSALLLADVLVGAGVSSVDNTKIRDRRKWARGADVVKTGPSGGSFVFTATTYTILHANLTARLECSGVPLDLELAPSQFQGAANANESIEFDFFVDGAGVRGSTDRFLHGTNLSQLIHPSGIRASYTPAAGSHVIEVRAQVTGANYNIGGQTQLLVRERIRQSAANNATTSG